MMDQTAELLNPRTLLMIASFVRRRVAPDDASDVMQDTILKLLARAPLPANPEAYCLSVARDTALELSRKRTRESYLLARYSAMTSYADHADREPDPEAIIANQQQFDTALQSLSPTTQQVFLMVVGQGRTHQEVAQSLGISPRAVGRHVQRAARISVHQYQGTKSRPALPPSKFNGTLYELDTNLVLPPKQIITDVRPKLQVASAALAERLKSCPEGVHELSPQQFETLVAELFADMTTGRVEITPFTRDGGRDLLAYVDLRFGRLLCLIETKKYRRDRPVGIELVRSLYGVVCDEDASQGTLVTTSTFSQDARRFESRHQHRLSLRDYQNVADWIRHYRAAPTLRGNTVRN